MTYFANEIGDRMKVETTTDDGRTLKFKGEIIGTSGICYVFMYKGEEVTALREECLPIARGWRQHMCRAFGHVIKPPYSSGYHSYPYKAFVGRCPRCNQAITWNGGQEPGTLKEHY